MKIEIITKNQIKKLIEEMLEVKFREVISNYDKLNERMMRLEDEFKVRRKYE